MVTFTSPNFQRYAPNTSNTSQCQSNIVISSLHFTGGILAGILDLFEKELEKELITYVNPLLCSELSTLCTGELAGLLLNFSHYLTPYLTESARAPVDPMKEEAHILANLEREHPGVDLVSNLTVTSIFETLTKLIYNNLEAPDANGNPAVNALIEKNFPNGIINVSNLNISLLALNDPKSFIKLNISLSSLMIEGLDTFKELHLLQPLSNYTIMSAFSLDHLKLSVGVNVEISPASSTVISSPGIKEFITVSTGVKDLRFNVSFFMGLVESTLQNITLRTLMANPAGCLTEPLEVFNITDFELHAASLYPFEVSGFISSGLDHLTENITEAFEFLYEDVLSLALPGIGQQGLKPMLNSLITNFLQNASCPFVSKPIGETLINLMDSSIVKLLETLSKQVTPATLNSLLVSAAGGNPNAPIQLSNGSLLGKPVRFTSPQLGTLYFDIGNASLLGLNSFTSVNLFDVTGPEEIRTRLGLAGPVRPKFDIRISLSGGPQPYIYDALSIGMNLTGVDLSLQIFLALYDSFLDQMRLCDGLDFKCWLAWIEEAYIMNNATYLNTSLIAVDIRCNDVCTSPGLPALMNTTRNASAIIQSTKDLNAFVQKLFNTLTGESGKNLTMREINEYAIQCPSAYHIRPGNGSIPPIPPVPPTTDGSCFYQKLAVIVGGSAIGTMLILGIILYYIRKYYKNHSRNGQQSGGKSGGGLYETLLGASLSSSSSSLYDSNSTNKPNTPSHGMVRGRVSTVAFIRDYKDYALLHHPAIPWLVRYGVLFGILCNLAFFLSGHTSVGASVDLVAYFAGDRIEYDTIYTFSLAGSLSDMWGACAIVLATLIGTFSGAWPYIKLLLMIFVWMVPPSSLSTRSRGTFIKILDYMGKWSLIDLYVLVMSMIAFYVRIQSPETPILPTNFYDVSLWVTPVWGLYAFCIAVTASLILNHIQVVVHRNALASDREALEEMRQSYTNKMLESQMNGGGNRTPRRRATSWFYAGTVDLIGPRKALVKSLQSVNNHIFHVDGVYPVKRIGFTSFGKLIILLLPISTLVLFLCGCYLPSFRFTVNGVAGIIQDFGRTNSSVTDYSLLTVMSKLLRQAENADITAGTFGINYIAVLFILFAFLVPISLLIGLMILWTLPMTLFQQKQMFFVCEVMSSWSACEVYIIATAIAALEIASISRKIVGNACDSLNPIFQLLVIGGFIPQRDALCFEVSAEIRYGTYILMAASVVKVISTFILVGLTEASIEDRETRIKGLDHETDVLLSGMGQFALRQIMGYLVVEISDNEDDMTDRATAWLRRRASSLNSTSNSFAEFDSKPSISEDLNFSSAGSQALGASFSSTGGGLGGDTSLLGEEALPPGWSRLVDPETNQTFYWNEINGNIQTQKPLSQGSIGSFSFKSTVRSTKLNQLNEVDEEEEDGEMHL
eukprot:g4289.t1